jgi:hypothetical protein
MVEGLQPMEQHNVSRVSPLATRGPLRPRGVELHREFEELSFRGSSQRSRHPGIQKPNDRLQHPIRGEGIAPMYPEDPPTQAEHHCLVRVGEDSFHVPETKCR